MGSRELGLANAEKRGQETKIGGEKTAMSDNKELDALIHFWKDSLAERWTNEGRLVMSPSTAHLVEQTIRRLEELKQIKE